ncbi:hypothetical protein ER308_07090 [Egibacter rhizosphaerae]|uniref:Uncharacterized protein n=1 Tax=Egibacter rhizosphaerae TaxID=1670831 RepID=A0A411YDQ5_9ACTN|nr:hypothetical protein [Egibacter rhizosphaerae]QBI19331.1 hypothetical protein ER308_07090 [Egibacter rhizosphaerae]
MATQVTIDGATFEVSDRGRVFWSDDWGRVIGWAIRREHGLRDVHYGAETYGHVSVHFDGQSTGGSR